MIRRIGARRAVPVIALLVLLLAALRGGAEARSASRPSPVGTVRWIFHGLSVQPPKQHAARGRVKQSLYSAYQLQTQKAQKASVGFRDGTLLYLNQRTDAVLASVKVTRVTSGEVQETVVPGTSHRVQTSAVTAAAVGTRFDVKVSGKHTIVTVIEGAVRVSAKKHTVLVKSGEQVTVTQGHAPPATPTPVDTSSVQRWTAQIPPPSTPIGVNIALDANGGNAFEASSTRSSANGSWDLRNVNDGNLTTSWQSAEGAVTNQSFKVRFQGLTPYTITAIGLDCAATAGQPANDALKDFQVLSAPTAGAGSTLVPALSGTCQERSGTQYFTLPSPLSAAEVELVAKDNWGGLEGIAVAEIAVIATTQPPVLGTPTPVPTAPPATDTPTPTATPIATDTPTALPTATEPPTVPATDTPTTPSISSVAFSPQTPSSVCGQAQSSSRYCGITGNGVVTNCDLQPVNGGSGEICGDIGTSSTSCNYGPEGDAVPAPTDCHPQIVSVGGISYLYIYVGEDDFTSSAYQSSPSDFELLAGDGSVVAESAEANPAATGAPDSGFTAQQLPPYDPNNPEASEEGGWLRFAIPGPGEYTAMWGDGGMPAITMGVFTVN